MGYDYPIKFINFMQCQTISSIKKLIYLTVS